MTRTLYDPEVAKNAELKLLLMQLKRRFTNISKECEEKIKSSTTETIEKIAVNIFDINDIKDLDKYLN